MEPNFVEINGKKYRVSFEEIKDDKCNFNIYRRKGQEYWVINYDGVIQNYLDNFNKFDDDAVRNGNYFLTKEDAEYVAKREILFRKMLNFSLRNGLKEITRFSNRYLLAMDCYNEVHYVAEGFQSGKKNCVYFATEEVAREALRRYGKEFKELYGNH